MTERAVKIAIVISCEATKGEVGPIYTDSRHTVGGYHHFINVYDDQI